VYKGEHQAMCFDCRQLPLEYEGKEGKDDGEAGGVGGKGGGGERVYKAQRFRGAGP
jgi:hypothetical protein